MISTVLERYKNWLGKKPDRSTADPALNQTYLQLYQAQRKHYFVEVRIDGDDVVYQSMILSLDPEEKTVLIDELFPTGFVGLPGQRVQVSIRQPEGKKIKFGSTILEQHRHEDSPLYVLSMPQLLETDQRRGAYRLALGSLAIRPRFVGPDQQNYFAQLRNLSSGGVAMELEVEHPEDFHYDDQLKHVAFDFAGISFDCDMAVRNVSVADTDNHKIVIGAEFLDLPTLDQRVLEKSIMRIQRDRIRLGSDMEAQLAMA